MDNSEAMEIKFKQVTFNRNLGRRGFSEAKGHGAGGLVAHKPKGQKWQVYHAASGAVLGRAAYPNLAAAKSAVAAALQIADWSISEPEALNKLVREKGREAYDAMLRASGLSK